SGRPRCAKRVPRADRIWIFCGTTKPTDAASTRAEGCRRGRIAPCRLRLARVREPFRLLLELGPALDGRIESRPGLVELMEHRLDLVARPSIEVGLRDALLERRNRLLEALDLVRQRVELPLQLVRELLRRRGPFLSFGLGGLRRA